MNWISERTIGLPRGMISYWPEPELDRNMIHVEFPDTQTASEAVVRLNRNDRGVTARLLLLGGLGATAEDNMKEYRRQQDLIESTEPAVSSHLPLVLDSAVDMASDSELSFCRISGWSPRRLCTPSSQFHLRLLEPHYQRQHLGLQTRFRQNPRPDMTKLNTSLRV